jgi:hypothetical protein
MDRFLAVTKYGACGRCPEITWHNGAPCPLWGAATERERSVPCSSCRRPTFRNDAQCSRCAASLSGRAREGGPGASPAVRSPAPLTPAQRAARNEATARAVDRLIEATVPRAGASRTALQATGPGTSPRVLP